MDTKNTDRIEKTVILRAPRAKLWRALTDAAEFSTWFRLSLEGPFAVGKHVRGRLTYPGYEHITVDIEVTRMDAQDHFAYRWHPYAIDPKVDYTTEEPTLVEFHLADADGGTRLTVVESGFDRLPASRREIAFRMNSEGWTGQMENVRKHVAG